MRALSGTAAGSATEIDRRDLQETGAFAGRVPRINGQRITFGDLARFACPRKTAAWLAHITRHDVRTCEKWLSGQHEPPAEALGAIMFEIMRQFNQRTG